MVSRTFRMGASGRHGGVGPLAGSWIVLLLCLLVGTPALATVGVAIEASTATPTAGGNAFGITITLTNNDTMNPAANVQLTLPSPPGILFDNWGVSGPAAGAVNCIGPEYRSNGTLYCSSVSLPASGVATISVVALAATDQSGIRTYTARVVSGGTANSASVQQNLINASPLALALAATSTAAAGTNVVYRIEVNNTGPSAALGVAVTDVLPANTSFVSVQGAVGFAGGCDFNPGNATVTCAAAKLPKGVHEINLILKTAAGFPAGMLSNSAALVATTGQISGSPATASTTITN